MKRKTISILCDITILIGIFLGGCDYSTEHENNNTQVETYSEADVLNAANCWLQTFGLSFGDWVGDSQCTELARTLTTAPSYGKDDNGTLLGGYDYVVPQHNRGINIPLLAEVKNNLKPCDNLILVGPKFDPSGHTVIVFYPDLSNDKIYYLDQNYNGEGITLRHLLISENENNAYVISADCKKPINCQLSGTQGPIIAVPQPSLPAIEATIVVATINPTESLPLLDVNDAITIIKWLDYSFLHNDDYPFTILVNEEYGVFSGGPCWRSNAAAPKHSAARSTLAPIAAKCATATTPAAIAIAPNASMSARKPG